MASPASAVSAPSTQTPFQPAALNTSEAAAAAAKCSACWDRSRPLVLELCPELA